jgi:dTDP-glucose 4,6-dehydratase
MKKVLITGADGFIGSHLTEKLVKLGYKTKAFVYYNSFSNWGWIDRIDKRIRDEIEIFPGDIRDPNGVRSAIEGCDSVLHLAALIGIPFSYHSPDTYIDTNIKGTLNILQAARDFDIEKVIHTSTSEVYGSALTVPIDENHPLQGQSPYSASKIGADQLALSFFRSFETPVGIIRPFNTYGPRQSARAVIPTIITQLASGKNEIKLGSLSPTRDFTFIEDTVNGFISGLKNKSIIGETVNLGTNFEISINNLTQEIAKLMDKKIVIKSDDKRYRPKKSEVDRLLSNNKKAKELLNWSPLDNGLDGLINGLKITIDWFTNKKNLSYYKTNIYNV